MNEAISATTISQEPKRAVFLDRDGILNVERGDYVWRDADFIIPADVPAHLQRLKAAGYRLIVVTNQGGVAKGLYPASRVWELHDKIQQACGGVLDALYFSPWADAVSKSLMRKPSSLMLERGMAKYGLHGPDCWLIGDAARDLEAAAAVGVRPILLPTLKEKDHHLAQRVVHSFAEAVEFILQTDNRI